MLQGRSSSPSFVVHQQRGHLLAIAGFLDMSPLNAAVFAHRRSIRTCALQKCAYHTNVPFKNMV